MISLFSTIDGVAKTFARIVGDDNKFVSPLLLNLTAFKIKPTGGVLVLKSTHLYYE